MPEPAGQEARRVRDCSRIEFQDCSLQSVPAAASAMVKHLAQLYGSILHAGALRAPTTVCCTTTSRIPGPSVLARAYGAWRCPGFGRWRGVAHWRRMETVALPRDRGRAYQR